ncbi:hypothetical protein ACFLXM_01835 [Chloroflexota bacterium]
MVRGETGSCEKLDKRLAGAGLFVIFGADEQDDYYYPRGILHREGAGRSRAAKEHLKYPWGGLKTNKIEYKYTKTNKRDCLNNVVAYRTGQPSTKGDFVLRLSRGEEVTRWWQLQQRIRQPQNQERPDNMKGGKK